MQLVNYPHEMPSTAAIEKASARSMHSLRPWIPGMILVAAVSVVSLLGSNTSVNPGAELNWISRMANSGDSDAQLQEGLAYRDGRYGLTPDATKGLYWLKLAAQNGNAYAADAVGSMYANGNGTEKDLSLAMTWWKKAMRGGSQEARLHMSEAWIKAGNVQQAEKLLS